MLRKVLSLVLGAILFAALLALIPQAALAAHKVTTPRIPLSHCVGHGCDNVDPYAGNCVTDANGNNVVSDIGSKTIFPSGGGFALGIVELRYSSTCQTAWTRTTSYDGAADLVADICRQSDNKCLNFGLDNTTVAYGNMFYIGCSPTPCFDDAAFALGAFIQGSVEGRAETPYEGPPGS
jgi:hypothetical protein